MRSLPNGSVAAPSKSNGTVTELVTPLMVRSPVSSKLASPVCVDAGGDEGDLRVLLHAEEVVAAQVLVALGVAGVDAGGLDGQLGGGLGRVGRRRRTAVPSNSLNAPRTLVTIAWRATKPMRVWAASMT